MRFSDNMSTGILSSARWNEHPRATSPSHAELVVHALAEDEDAPGGPTIEEVLAWARQRIDGEFIREVFKRVSDAGWKDARGMPIGNWRAYFQSVSDREGGSVRLAHNRRLDRMSECERADWRSLREGLALKIFARNHGRRLVPGDWHSWPEPFEFKEFKQAYAELDAAVDRGEVDIYYRSRYGEVG